MNKKLINKLLSKTTADYNFLADEFNNTRQYPWAEFTILNKYVKDGDSVLDLGCGNGRLFEVLKSKKIKYTGVDNCSTLITKAQEKFSALTNVNFIKDDICNLATFTDSSFNVVFMIAVMHHIPSQDLQLKIFKEVARVLKPGGYILMTNWNLRQKKFWHSRFNLFFRLRHMPLSLIFQFKEIYFPWKHRQKIIYRYCHFFSPEELEVLLYKSDFSVLVNKFTQKGVEASSDQAWTLLTIAQKK